MGRRPGRHHPDRHVRGRAGHPGVRAGGFVTATSIRGLTLDPPLLGRDLDAKVGESVTLEFTRRVAPTIHVAPTRITEDDVGEPGSFIQWVADTTPGGPVTAQMIMVIFVYVAMLQSVPATPRGILAAGTVLVLTPWLPVLIGFGSSLAASIIFVNVAVGGFAYKAWIRRTES